LVGDFYSCCFPIKNHFIFLRNECSPRSTHRHPGSSAQTDRKLLFERYLSQTRVLADPSPVCLEYRSRNARTKKSSKCLLHSAAACQDDDQPSQDNDSECPAIVSTLITVSEENDMIELAKERPRLTLEVADLRGPT
jgi:hypothetical protein